MSVITTLICNTGISAIIGASSSGPLINVTSFQIGSDIITPTADMTGVTSGGVMGTAVYTGSSDQITYEAIDSNTINYVVTLDETVGNFTIGNIGLFLSNGSIFSISALSIAESKTASGESGIGNYRIFNIMITFSNLSSISDFTINVATDGSLPVVANETDLPNAGSAPYNTYFLQNVEFNNINMPGLALRYDDQWYYLQATNYQGATTGIANIITSGTAMTIVNGGTYILKLTDPADFTFTLPTPSVGLSITIKDGSGDAETYPISIVGTIDGNSGYTMSTNWEVLRIIGNGVNWNAV